VNEIKITIFLFFYEEKRINWFASSVPQQALLSRNISRIDKNETMCDQVHSKILTRNV
jgi:hypothetical protein